MLIITTSIPIFILKKHNILSKYVIEREIPEAGNLRGDKLKGIAQISCGVLLNLEPQIQWVQKLGDKIDCVYMAPNKQMIMKHARQGHFPANAVNEISALIAPATAE